MFVHWVLDIQMYAEVKLNGNQVNLGNWLKLILATGLSVVNLLLLIFRMEVQVLNALTTSKPVLSIDLISIFNTSFWLVNYLMGSRRVAFENCIMQALRADIFLSYRNEAKLVMCSGHVKCFQKTCSRICRATCMLLLKLFTLHLLSFCVCTASPPSCGSVTWETLTRGFQEWYLNECWGKK